MVLAKYFLLLQRERDQVNETKCQQSLHPWSGHTGICLKLFWHFFFKNVFNQVTWETERDTHIHPVIHWFSPTCLQWLGVGEAQAGIQELKPSLSNGWMSEIQSPTPAQGCASGKLASAARAGYSSQATEHEKCTSSPLAAKCLPLFWLFDVFDYFKTKCLKTYG